VSPVRASVCHVRPTRLDNTRGGRQARNLADIFTSGYSRGGRNREASRCRVAWIGSILDERFHTGPLFVLLGTFTGFGAGFYSMYRHLVLDRSDELGGVDESDPNGRSS
jgi:hypothetical protein